MSFDYCYIEFVAEGGEAFERLSLVVESLKRDPSAGKQPEKGLLAFLRESELDTFWWPNQSQLAEVQSRWGDVPIRISDKMKNEQTEWDVYSMFEVIAESDYTLLGLKSLGDSRYHLAFTPNSYPFGGTESLQKLVRAFGFSVTAVDDGTGRIGIESDGPSQVEVVARKKPWWRLWR